MTSAHSKYMVVRRCVLKRYGLTPEHLNKMKEERANRCDICLRQVESIGTNGLHLDHDHATNIVRGMLCGPCNRMLGLVGDSIETLERAIAYLRTHTSAN